VGLLADLKIKYLFLWFRSYSHIEGVAFPSMSVRRIRSARMSRMASSMPTELLRESLERRRRWKRGTASCQAGSCPRVDSWAYSEPCGTLRADVSSLSPRVGCYAGRVATNRREIGGCLAVPGRTIAIAVPNIIQRNACCGLLSSDSLGECHDGDVTGALG